MANYGKKCFKSVVGNVKMWKKKKVTNPTKITSKTTDQNTHKVEKCRQTTTKKIPAPEIWYIQCPILHLLLIISTGDNNLLETCCYNGVIKPCCYTLGRCRIKFNTSAEVLTFIKTSASVLMKYYPLGLRPRVIIITLTLLPMY